ncbi:Transmembrane E3 ubiquitin-protein ligase 1 [Triticum urartu]|uniref:RING-type E3 ubiquitin transferase n=1 Tax=Triticum urartu TaxID=4572 RepID=M8AKZ7_TRIUA|nr:Transmembrane E3 ubiquitin-protein ligase 1 [Triticum urartu]
MRRSAAVLRVAVVSLVVLGLALPPLAAALRPLRERVASAGAAASSGSWADEHAFYKRDDNDMSPYSWNITGTYKGSWSFAGATNGSSRFLEFVTSKGDSVLELLSTPTKISGVHYVQGTITFHDVIDKSHDRGVAQISGADGEPLQEEDYFLSNPYHLCYATYIHKNYNQALLKVINIIMNYGFSPLKFSKILLKRRTEGRTGAAKVSIIMIGQQAIMDAYLCLLHLTAGILVESLFNAFATAAFFKFVVFSIFEMRYLLAIWKASRPLNSGEGWEIMRRELSVLYSRFYGILLGGILLMYELHNFLRPLLFLMYSFWIPQIVTNVIRDTRKPLHPQYILGMTATRVAIPLYIFGCPSNFMRIEPDKKWCIAVTTFMSIQAAVLLLQHYLGSRCFIPRQTAFFWEESFSCMTATRVAIPLYIFGCPSNFMRIEPDKKWCIAVTTFMSIQAAVLLLQHYLGSRCFIPRQILPEKYCYHRKVEDSTNQPIDCVICMTTIDLSQRTSEYMVAPCEHIFHSGCLQRWMDIKMECPTCRRSLPPA